MHVNLLSNYCTGRTDLAKVKEMGTQGAQGTCNWLIHPAALPSKGVHPSFGGHACCRCTLPSDARACGCPSHRQVQQRRIDRHVLTLVVTTAQTYKAASQAQQGCTAKGDFKTGAGCQQPEWPKVMLFVTPLGVAKVYTFAIVSAA